MERKLFGCFLFLGLTCSVVQCQVCPSPEDITPCTCKQYPMPSITTCADITDMNTLYEVFGKSFDIPIIQFVLSNSNVMYLPATSVSDKKFQGIRIESSAMTSVFDGQPGQTDHLVEFRLSDVRLLRGLQWSFFSSFTNLSRIEVKDTEVKKLGQEFRDNIHKGIVHLKMANTKTAVLEDGVFDTCSELEWLEITYGKINSLKRTMFPQKNKLWYLNFSGNLLSSLPTDIFSNMPKLQMVFFANNQITTLSEEVFGDLYRRTELSLDLLENPLVCDCKVRWYLPMLRFRSVSGHCVDPPSMRDKSFNFMTPQDFNFCNVVPALRN